MEVQEENIVDEINGCLARKLVKPFTLSDLMKKDYVIELKNQNSDIDLFEEPTFDQNDFNAEDVQKFTRQLIETSDNPLGTFKERMSPIYPENSTFEDAKLLKKIKVEGSGGKPPKGAFVYVHYMYYTEFDETPRDITYLRETNPERFQLGVTFLIPAVKLAISSMQKGEKSDFFASYELCFGEMGCEPRIPKKADLLFEIELVTFNVIDTLSSDTSIKNEVPTFERVIKRTEDYNTLAKAMIKENNIKGAIRRYKEAEKLLLMIQVKHDEEKLEVEDHLCKIYRNMMVCYNKKENFKLTCSSAECAIKSAPRFSQKDVKLWFLWGKALIGLQEWYQAKEKFEFALKLAPSNSDMQSINKEIEKVTKSLMSYEKDSRAKYGKMFISQKDETQKVAKIVELESKVDEPTEMEYFYKLLKIQLGEFKMKDRVYTLEFDDVQDYNDEEIEVMQKLANLMGLKLSTEGKVIFSK